MKKLALFVIILVSFCGKIQAQDTLIHETFDRMPNWAKVYKHGKATYKIQNGKLILSGKRVELQYPISEWIKSELENSNFDIEADFRILKNPLHRMFFGFGA